MGNCFGKRNKTPQSGHTLGTEMAPPNAATDTLTKDNSESQRDVMLAAAERRRLEAESRGVQQSGGKLSKRLADQKRQSPHEQNPGEMPERLVWD